MQVHFGLTDRDFQDSLPDHVAVEVLPEMLTYRLFEKHALLIQKM
jgi:hypothetical protein